MNKVIKVMVFYLFRLNRTDVRCQVSQSSPQYFMRFLLYNIRYGTGSSRYFHLPVPFGGYLKPTVANIERIASFIKSLDPDVVGLVEVDSGSFRSDRQNQAELIARQLGHFHVYQSKYRPNALIQRIPILNKQGNAFLTRETIHAQTFHYFQDGVKRLVIELELEECVIFLVHLSLFFRHRHHQLRDLYGLVKAATKPVIVAGDFNLLWGDRELQLFLAATGLRSANTSGAPSHPSHAPHRQLDYILYGPGVRVTHFEIPAVRLSDHMPLVCDLEIDKNTRPFT